MQEAVLSKTSESENRLDFSKLIEFPGKRGFFMASLAVINVLKEEFPDAYNDWEKGDNFGGEIPMLPELLATEQILKLNEALSFKDLKNNIVRFESFRDPEMCVDVKVPIVNPWELAKFYEASLKQTENLVIHPEFDRVICMDERDISDGLGIAHIAGLLPESEQDDFALSILLSIQEGFPTEELLDQRRDRNNGKILIIEPHEGCGGAKLKLMDKGLTKPTTEEVNHEAMIQAKAFRGRIVKMALWLNNYRKERGLPEITFALTEDDIGIPDRLKKISPHAHVPVGVLAHMHKRSSFGDKDLPLVNKEGAHLNGNVFDELFGNVFDISSLINSDAELANEIILALKLSFGDHGVEHYFDEPGENIFPVFLSIKDEESAKRAMKIKKLVEKMNNAGPEYPIRIFFVDIRNSNSKIHDNVVSLESTLAGGTVEHPNLKS